MVIFSIISGKNEYLEINHEYFNVCVRNGPV